MRPRAIAAAVRFAVRHRLPEPPLWVCPPCVSSHGSTPLTPAVARQHGHTPLTRYELEVAARLLADPSLTETLDELEAKLERAEATP